MQLLHERLPSTEEANPTMRVINEIIAILENESLGEALPLSLAEIERRMNARQTRHATIRAAVQELAVLGIAAIGSKGVIFTRPSGSVRRTKSVPL